MANITTAAPIVVEPSQYWEGNDGPWSTFNIHVGTPPQPARVLVGTALGQTWVVSANKTQGGCTSADPSSCPQSRGALVNVNQSSTWQDQGIYEFTVELNLPDYIDNYDAGDFGLDTMGLGLPGSNGTQEPNMVVSAFATKDFYLGYLGVTNHPTNFTEFDDPHPTFLSTLKAQNKIPSLSYAYSAGAQYRFKKVDGTLTLGGYDASKFTPNAVDFQFASDISRDLVVGLQSITFSDPKSTTQSLLPEGILTYIDATVPHIWLPQDACTLFENAFGITYNDTVDRYLVNETIHQQLLSQNANISFVLGNDVNGGESVDINLPYAAFDLQVSSPIVDTMQYYFPLRRAANDTQYTLGRTFLQESYLIVNYEQSNFSVSQNIWVEDARSQIVAIRSNTTAPPVSQTHKKSSIAIGAIVGIIVAAVVLVLLAALAAFFIISKRRKRRREKENPKKVDDDPFRKAEMDGTGKPPIGELYAEGKVGEVDSTSKVEMQGSQPGLSLNDQKNTAEIEGSTGGAEMEGTKGGVEMEGSTLRAEMAGDHVPPVELYAGPQGLFELPSPNTSDSELASPISSNGQRTSRLSATWKQRQKAMPRLPGAESRNISPDAYFSNQRVGQESRSRGTPQSLTPNDISSPSSENRERRPSGSSSNPISSPSSDHRPRRPSGAFHQPRSGLEAPSRSTTPMEVSSQSSESRERRPGRGNALDRRMESNISNQASPIGVPSPTDGAGRLARADSAEEWNRRLASRERRASPQSPDALSPMSPVERRPSPLGENSRSRTPRSSPLAEKPSQGNFF